MAFSEAPEKGGAHTPLDHPIHDPIRIQLGSKYAVCLRFRFGLKQNAFRRANNLTEVEGRGGRVVMRWPRELRQNDGA